jgi:hypothetical protein
VSIDNSV